ncbi:MAG: chitobiase/beta-hexosaminidase C-terminal domain-containing protein, partial [Sedimentisphaerales bacterium]|nr:chitobiase/beta-hexosaminidase C-terminal domain-containing protein [Sedimentisphaerales bacterium]
MASNSGTLGDPQGQYDDWIELHNPSDTPLDAGGMYLTDNPGLPMKWRLPANDPGLTTIPGRGFLLVWADGDVGQAGLHAAFQLNADGDQIALFAGDGETLIDSVSFGTQRTDVSLGRYPDGTGAWGHMKTATPGRANGPAYDGVVVDVALSQGRGFYTEPITVALATSTPEAAIVYTLDGSRPRAGHGHAYDGPICLETTAVVRAAAFKPGFLETKVATHSYIFPEDVIHQSADVPGYPRPWTWLGGSGYAYHDYEMDPDV